jgi:Fructose-bisphosphate aldolase class-I
METLASGLRLSRRHRGLFGAHLDCSLDQVYGRALQDPALEAWHGRDQNLAAGQRALYQRARSNGAASAGKYTEEMDAASSSADNPPHRRNWRED